MHVFIIADQIKSNALQDHEAVKGSPIDLASVSHVYYGVHTAAVSLVGAQCLAVVGRGDLLMAMEIRCSAARPLLQGSLFHHGNGGMTPLEPPLVPPSRISELVILFFSAVASRSPWEMAMDLGIWAIT